MNETIIAYFFKNFLSNGKIAYLHFMLMLIFRAAEIDNFYKKYKGGIMSNKAANLESDSIPRGCEPGNRAGRPGHHDRRKFMESDNFI